MGNCCKIYNPSNSEYYSRNQNTKLKISEKINEIIERTNLSNIEKSIEYSLNNQKVRENYKIISLLGTGLFSKVYLVKCKNNHSYAMKVIKKKKFQSKDHIEKILIEKEIMKHLNHRNILKLYKTFQTKNDFYFIIEYAEKGTTFVSMI